MHRSIGPFPSNLNLNPNPTSLEIDRRKDRHSEWWIDNKWIKVNHNTFKLFVHKHSHRKMEPRERLGCGGTAQPKFTLKRVPFCDYVLHILFSVKRALWSLTVYGAFCLKNYFTHTSRGALFSSKQKRTNHRHILIFVHTKTNVERFPELFSYFWNRET